MYIYEALTFSIINYAIEIYGANLEQKHIDMLQIHQNTFLKIILNLDRQTPTNSVHIKANILKIKDHIKMRLNILIYDLLYQRNIPLLFKDIVTFNHDKYFYNTRNRNNLFVNHNSYNRKSKVISVASINWNTIPFDLRLTSCRNKFKETLKANLLNKY